MALVRFHGSSSSTITTTHRVARIHARGQLISEATKQQLKVSIESCADCAPDSDNPDQRIRRLGVVQVCPLTSDLLVIVFIFCITRLMIE